MLRCLALIAMLAVPAAARADAPLREQVEAVLAAAPAGTRFGLLVVDDAGREVIGIAPDQRFIPASNTKLFTTAAAYALLPGITGDDQAGGAEVYLVPAGRGRAPEVRLVGRGDARLSSAADCTVDCLAALADAIAAKTRVVGDVVGDDTAFTDQRWSPGMSWNNIGSSDGTAASALSLDSNELAIEAAPGKAGARRPRLTAPGYLEVANRAETVPADASEADAPRLAFRHEINSRGFAVYGAIAAGSPPQTEHVGIDDPADYAAARLARMLADRGVRVKGRARAVHRLPGTAPPGGDPGLADGIRPVASLAPPPLADDVTIINKRSQNLHAELLLRRLAPAQSQDTLEDGLAAERAVLDAAGIARAGYDFSDGSGMSTYNRISPRAAVALLRWAGSQPWGARWRASLPVGGVDGTLARRFQGGPLAGRILAKTGTLNAVNALSGYLIAASGRELTFSFFANDVPGGQSATAQMDSALLLIAAAN